MCLCVCTRGLINSSTCVMLNSFFLTELVPHSLFRIFILLLRAQLVVMFYYICYIMCWSYFTSLSAFQYNHHDHFHHSATAVLLKRFSNVPLCINLNGLEKDSSEVFALDSLC